MPRPLGAPRVRLARRLVGFVTNLREKCGLVMAVQKLGMGMLVVEFREVTVDGFGMAAFGFELDRQVLDLEFTGHPVPDRLKEVGR